MNDKIVIREPLFVAPNECKGGAAQHEQDKFFGRERKERANLIINHIGTNGSYKKCEKWEQDEGKEQENGDPPLQLNEREDMSCFVKYKEDIHNLSHEKNVFISCRKGEINTKYNIMDNIHDIHYTNKSANNLNDYLRHVKINHTAPCVGEFRTCMNCFLNISTLFCKTCNIFLCAVCSIKLHKNNQDHIVNVASSGLFQNDYSYNEVIMKEKDKWLVEMDNNIPVKIREKCSVHTNEYVKYACKTCHYTLLCTDCLLNDPLHVQNEVDGENVMEKRQDGSHCSGGHSPTTQTIVSINKNVETATHENDLMQLKPGFKLLRGSHEIYTLVDAKNEIKQELNEKLEVLCKKSLILKNTIPSLRNIYKYGKITNKNVKRSIRASFTITNIFLEKKKKKLHEELKMVQDKSTQFLKKMDDQRINYHSYLEKKKNELQHMVKLSGRNAGLSLDYYVDKLESYKCLFFSKDNLIDMEKKLEIPHSKMKSEHLPSLVETMKEEVLEAKKKVSDTSALIKKEFEKLFNCSSQISVYPAHFKHILQKRIYNKERVEPVDGDARRQQRYFHVLPFTDLYMNMEVTYEQQFWRKDSLHEKWEVRTVSLRSIYLCVHTHADTVGSGVGKNCMGPFSADGSHRKIALPSQLPVREDSPQSGSSHNNHFIPPNELNNFSNDIESVVSISNVSVKLFSDPDITNITILEKRNHPYGVEITEYNEKRELCGYWLLTAKKESDVNALFKTLVNIKKENKGSALIPSFHPKINMKSPMFHLHQKNINSVYKHLAANLLERPVVLSEKQTKENRLSGDGLSRQQDSLQTVQSSDTSNYNYDRFMRDSSLLYYYDGMDDPEYNQHVNKYQIEDFVPGQINCSDYNDEMALAECNQNMCAESSSIESINPFCLPTSALGEDAIGGGHSQTGPPETSPPQTKSHRTDTSHGKVFAQEGVSGARLHTLAGVHSKKRNTNPPDVNIDTVKPNVVHEEQHFMLLNVGSNFSHGDYTTGMYSNGMQVMKGVNVGGGVHTGCYANGDAQVNAVGGSSFIGGIPVSAPRGEEGTNVGEHANEHLGEKPNGDHSAHVSHFTTVRNSCDKLGVKNGIMLSSVPVESPPKMEGGMVDACGGTGKGEPYTEEVATRVGGQVLLHSTATSVSSRKTNTDVEVLEDGLCMHLIHGKGEGDLTGGDTKVNDLQETLAHTGELLLNNDEVTKFLRRLDWANKTSGDANQVGGAEPATRPNSYSEGKRLTEESSSPTVETKANNTAECLNQRGNRTRNADPEGERASGKNEMELVSDVKGEKLVEVNPRCVQNKGESATTNGEKGGLNEAQWTTPGAALTRGDDNGGEEERTNRVHTGEQSQKETHLQTQGKNCVGSSLMEDHLPREEEKGREVSPTRMDNLSVIFKSTRVHVDGCATIVHGTEKAQARMRSAVGRLRLQQEERHKTPPPPRRKNNKDSAGTSAVSTSKPMARLKTLDAELEPAGDVPASVISRVMSQIGSKRVGS
ncbi:hypothetical protein AK88_00674 [Plasmodium fragile]|uniref:B box-type domain-containing protein n=1 Tax=Plasmodium fragile TaxID=5857 RepID=A0A0D9QRM9_PLAFR|nr:uncharacterized protein AK88_00674 [Plasmodium fragile]KJP89714.1 hypothetical protein AK88_00674 [Plasmodium fragile]